MKRVSYLPPTEVVSTLTATILLAYTLAHFIRLPSQAFTLQFAGVIIPVTIDITTITGLLVAGLVIGGMEALLRSHPQHPGQGTFINWLLPSLSAWVLGATLNLLKDSPYWWFAVLAGGLVLTLVCLAEYVVLTPENPLYHWATPGLSLLAFGLYLMLAIILHNMGMRLFWRVPALTAASVLVSLRILQLHLPGRRLVLDIYSAALLSAQSAAALHYLRLSPGQYGLLLLAPLYAFLAWINAHAEQAPRPWLEATLVAGALIVFSFLV